MAEFRVLVSDKLAKEGLQVFEQAEGIKTDVKPGLSATELLEIIGGYDALAVRSETKVTAEVIARADRLKVIGRAGIGIDNVDVRAASQRGILVMNTPEGNVVTTAEHAISLMCSLLRKVPQATASMRAGKWEKSKFQGREMFGKTLGVVGLGNIGKIVANRALGLKMKVVAYDPFVTKERAKELGVDLVELDKLLAAADIVTLHVPLTDGTKNIIDKNAIAKMKNGAFLINAARGGLVDEQAVVEALDAKKLSGAAFDVFVTEPTPADHPLLQRDDVVLTPHLGASTSEAQVNVSVAVAEQIVSYLKEGVIVNAFNAPALTAEQMETVGPYVQIAEVLGRMAGQMHAKSVQTIRLTLAGISKDITTQPIKIAALTGFLSSALGRRINMVSAPLMAQERGIEVIEERTSRAQDFVNAVTISVGGKDGSTEVVGALFAGAEPRVVMVDGYHLEIVPEGRIILTDHFDRPGIIGRIGTILGDHGVNISRLSLSRLEKDRSAKAAVSVDGEVTEDVLLKLEQSAGMERVRVIDLSDEGASHTADLRPFDR
jgi:D-3-phosphoglycerate dehydrogenase